MKMKTHALTSIAEQIENMRTEPRRRRHLNTHLNAHAVFSSTKIRLNVEIVQLKRCENDDDKLHLYPLLNIRAKIITILKPRHPTISE